MPDNWNHAWLYISRNDLEIEWQQGEQEGREMASLTAEFDRVRALDLEDLSQQPAAAALLDKVAALPVRSGYPYIEPSDLSGIQATCEDTPRLPPAPSRNTALEERVHGAWLGRVCGCLLGKPVEGWRRPRMWGYLKDTGRWPLRAYFSLDVPEAIKEKYKLSPQRPFIETVHYMPEDDDTNYTTMGLALLRRHGFSFTPLDVANFWLGNVPILHTCTAERVAYRNLCLLIRPPQSASFRNPYREWIGAQIRADALGYVCPGDPARAAALAWRDASISHIKNGIYGEMWVAAMLAAALVTDDLDLILRAGLAQIPASSRLHESIRRVMTWHTEGIGYDEAVNRVHGEWDENKSHDWCHTISNAMIVAIGLLWGDLDYELSICRAVQACFDTDCNGATVGSIVGAVLGAGALPGKWTAPVNDTLHTGIAGYNEVRISEIAHETAQLIGQQ